MTNGGLSQILCLTLPLMPTSHRTQSAVTGGTNRTNSKQDMKIALIGYGKMGHMIEEIARQRGHEIVSIIDVNNQDDFD